jgi:hypothetical protein
MNIGFHIAHQGGLEIEDPLFKEMSPKEIELFVRLQPGAIRYPGFYIKEPYLGTLVPQFYHAYPVWIAIFLKIFGPFGSLFVNPFFALLSLWTFWRLVQKIFNPRMALMACAFLGLSLPQIWNARFPTSEILAQYFILSGIYCLCLFEKSSFQLGFSHAMGAADHSTKGNGLGTDAPGGDKNIFGILAGSAFGMALLTRPTAILLIPCLIVYFASCFSTSSSRHSKPNLDQILCSHPSRFLQSSRETLLWNTRGLFRLNLSFNRIFSKKNSTHPFKKMGSALGQMDPLLVHPGAWGLCLLDTASSWKISRTFQFSSFRLVFRINTRYGNFRGSALGIWRPSQNKSFFLYPCDCRNDFLYR